MQPAVYAHRGASSVHAEHTLAAFEHAIKVEADGLECDVRLTADGHMVCLHDRTLKRVAQSERPVATLTLDELKAFDLAEWKHGWRDLDDEADEYDPERSGVVTLRQLLELAADAPRPTRLAIETKHPSRFGGLVEKRLIQALANVGWAGADSPVEVMSFSLTALQRVSRLAPDLRTVMLFDHAERWPLLRRRIGSDWTVGPGIKTLQESPRLVESLRRSRRDINVWTVNTPADLQLCVDLGVRVVMTDRPGDVTKWLADSSAR